MRQIGEGGGLGERGGGRTKLGERWTSLGYRAPYGRQTAVMFELLVWSAKAHAVVVG